MTYSTHKVLETGHIEVRQEKEDGQFHRHVIAPNEDIMDEPQDVQDAIMGDPDFEKYHTEENAIAYEQQLQSEDL